MFCKLRFLPAILCLLISGCGRRDGRGVERIAIPPFENLGEDASAGWAGYALSEAVAGQLTGVSRLHPVRVSGARDQALATATSVLQGYFVIAGPRLVINAQRRDVRRNRSLARFSVEEAFPDGLLRAADKVARWVEPQARAFDTSSVEALAALARGRQTEDPRAALASFELSASLDPDFGGAYAAWAGSLLLAGDRTGASRVIEDARRRGGRIAELRRAEMDLLQAALSSDAELRRNTLLRLSQITPADAAVFRQLAREDGAARRYQSAAGFYRRAASLDPLDQDAWNSLGYMEAAQGNLKGARQALSEYRRLAPRDANPLDSLGDVHFHVGQFRRAEEYYIGAFEMDHGFLGGATLYKAARARLMTGDVAGADELFRRYEAERSGAADPWTGYRRAQWSYLAGRRAEAAAEMAAVAAGAAAAEVQSLAASQLAVWNLLQGNGQQAERWTRAAIATAASATSRRMAAMCMALTGSAGPEGALPEEGTKRAAALRALVAGRFADAVPLLQEVSATTDRVGTDRVGVLLAWALIEAGRPREAAPWLETYGVPPPGLEDPLACFDFPRVFRLRAAVLEKQGRQAEASRAGGVYRRLGGS